MKSRCERKTSPDYKNYGGRGIYVCDEWHDFAAFRKDILALGYDYNRPTTEQTMDRIDNDGPYAPWNIRLVGPDIQAANRRKYSPPGCPKKVAAIDADGNVVETFNSIREASEWCGKGNDRANISAVAVGKRKSAYGYAWRYMDGKQ